MLFCVSFMLLLYSHGCFCVANASLLTLFTESTDLPIMTPLSSWMKVLGNLKRILRILQYRRKMCSRRQSLPHRRSPISIDHHRMYNQKQSSNLLFSPQIYIRVKNPSLMLIPQLEMPLIQHFKTSKFVFMEHSIFYKKL